MKKYLLILATVLYSSVLFGQSDNIRTRPVPSTGSTFNKQAQQDANLKAWLNLNIPHGPAYTLNNAKDSIGYVYFNTTLMRFGVYRGGGQWDTYLTLADLPAPADAILNQNSSAQTANFKIDGMGVATELRGGLSGIAYSSLTSNGLTIYNDIVGANFQIGLGSGKIDISSQKPIDFINSKVRVQATPTDATDVVRLTDLSAFAVKNGGNNLTGTQNVLGVISSNDGNLQSRLYGPVWSSLNGNLINLATGGTFRDLKITSAKSLILSSTHDGQPFTEKTITLRGDTVIRDRDGAFALFSADLAAYAKDTAVVHKNGTETITGQKNFNNNINSYSSINIYNNTDLKFFDNSNALTHSFHHPGVGHQLWLTDAITGDITVFQGGTIKDYLTNKFYLKGATDYTPANDTNVVHKTGNIAEDITGSKTFLNPITIGDLASSAANIGNTEFSFSVGGTKEITYSTAGIFNNAQNRPWITFGDPLVFGTESYFSFRSNYNGVTGGQEMFWIGAPDDDQYNWLKYRIQIGGTKNVGNMDAGVSLLVTGKTVVTDGISAKNYTASGTAGTGYYDVISQATSPASASGHLRIYSDSLNRLSWKNSTYRRTLQVPFLSDVTVRFPYKATPTLADSTDISNVYLKKADSTSYQTVANFFPKADPRYVNVTGDNMTGALNIVSVNPQLALNYDGTNTTSLGTNNLGYFGIVASNGTYIGGTGPTSSPFNISSSLQSSAANQFQFGGSSMVNYVAAFRKPTAFTLPDNTNYASNVFGAVNLTRAAGGAYNIANVVFKPLAAGGGVTPPTTSATVWIDDASTGSSGAARNYALYVAAGTSDFGGPLKLSTLTAGAGSAAYFTANGTISQTATGTSTQVLHGGTTPSFSAVSLTADVTGILPAANQASMVDNLLLKSANYTIVGGDFAAGKKSEITLELDCTAGNVTTTLPSATTFAGYTINVVKKDNSVNTATLTPVAGGAVLTSQNQSKTFKAINGVWYTF